MKLKGSKDMKKLFPGMSESQNPKSSVFDQLIRQAQEGFSLKDNVRRIILKSVPGESRVVPHHLNPRFKNADRGFGYF